MHNKNLAADVIQDHGFDPCRDPQCIAQDLADAGLLAPDLPEKTKRGDWQPTDTTTVTIEEDGTITVKEKISPIQTLIDWNATPEDTEKLAYAILAAANEAAVNQ